MYVLSFIGSFLDVIFGAFSVCFLAHFPLCLVHVLFALYGPAVALEFDLLNREFVVIGQLFAREDFPGKEKQNYVVDPDPHESAMILVGWNGIRIQEGKI